MSFEAMYLPIVLIIMKHIAHDFFHGLFFFGVNCLLLLRKFMNFLYYAFGCEATKPRNTNF